MLLPNFGYFSGAYVPVKKPFLKKHHIKARLKFVRVCLRHPSRTKKIVFSDEKIYHSQPKQTNLMIRRKRGPANRFDPKNIVYHQTGGPSVNVWYSIGPFGKGDLYCAENFELFDFFGCKIGRSPYRGFDSASYLKLLDHHALPELDKRMPNGYYFVQDNASIHAKKSSDKSETLVDRLLAGYPNVRRLNWPSKSPDLNVIENCHVLIQQELNGLLAKYRPKNKKGLLKLVRLAWLKVDNEKVIHVYNSFLGRCEKVYSRKGQNNYRE